MLKFDWNALRTGDNLVVHDPASPDLALTAGVVALTEAHTGRQGVGIRIVPLGGEPVILWPSPSTVHRVPRDSSEPCWRCDGAPTVSAPVVPTVVGSA